MKKIVGIIPLALLMLFVSCGEKKKSVSLEKYADTASYYAEKIADIREKQDMNDIDSYLQMEDSVSAKIKEADAVLESLFSQEKDTMFLPFEQTKNFERIKILSVWVVGMKYDKILLEARVKAVDNSSFWGPHAGLEIKDKEKNTFEVGGGIQGPTDEKLSAGTEYIFSGQIEHLHLLSNFKSILFDEEIKKW
ncbi:MAG: hypothetical protein MJ198_07720 [Bacteroidales bacterium]|nr:hypothetical protein [Bacteroidales bacterium]